MDAEARRMNRLILMRNKTIRSRLCRGVISEKTGIVEGERLNLEDLVGESRVPDEGWE